MFHGRIQSGYFNNINNTKSHSYGWLFLLEVNGMIEMHEDEFLRSYVSDEILLAVLAISGLAEKDKLLIKEDAPCSTSLIG